MKAKRDGISVNRKPGTSNQTGNTAPRYAWSSANGPLGGAMRIIIACIAYHLGYTDDKMVWEQKFPNAKELYKILSKLLPWFEKHYNEHRESKNISGIKIEPLNPWDIENRLRYMFVKPGSNKAKEDPRRYGISNEHHDSIKQKSPGGRGEIWTAYSDEIMKRLELNEQFTEGEVRQMGGIRKMEKVG